MLFFLRIRGYYQFQFFEKEKQMIIVGHRGAAGTEPENTILSLCRVLDFKADELEFDVQMTKDGHVVVIHAATVDRATNGYGPVTNMSIVDLCRLDAGKGEKDLTLHDLLDR